VAPVTHEVTLLNVSVHVLFFSGGETGASVCCPVPSPARMGQLKLVVREGKELTEHEESLVYVAFDAAFGALLRRLSEGVKVLRMVGH
jgi:hypothetical protein